MSGLDVPLALLAATRPALLLRSRSSYICVRFCFGGLCCFFCFAICFFACRIQWADAFVISRRLKQLFHIEHIAPIRSDRKIVIHLDGVERTILRAEATVHADICDAVELGRFRNRPVGNGIVTSHDPNTLRWAYLRTNPT